MCVGMLVKCAQHRLQRTLFVSTSFLFHWMSDAQKKFKKMVAHKRVPSVVTRARLPLSASLRKLGASPGWEDNAPQGACHVDRAAQLGCPQDMFFFSVSLPLICLPAYVTPITASVRGDSVPDWTLICPKDDIHHLLSLLVSAAPPCILLQLSEEQLEWNIFSFYVSRIKTGRGWCATAACLITAAATRPLAFCL